MNMRVALSIASLLAGAGHVLAQQPTGELPARLLLKEGWLVKSTAEVKEEGEVVSTVLNTLIKRGVYPDLRIGLNSFRIPDASDEFNRRHDLAKYSYLPDKRNPWKDPYWYRTEFGLPEAARGKRAWLNFNGINYRADVWLNGKRIADSQQVAGSFSRYRFDVTEPARAGQKNYLALKMHPVDHPGVPDAQLEVLGKDRGYHKEIMEDVTLVMSIGYDCMPTVPDLPTILFLPVGTTFTGHHANTRNAARTFQAATQDAGWPKRCACWPSSAGSRTAVKCRFRVIEGRGRGAGRQPDQAGGHDQAPRDAAVQQRVLRPPRAGHGAGGRPWQARSRAGVLLLHRAPLRGRPDQDGDPGEA